MKRTRQDGFVSIVVCMIIMTILSLITIGFAQIMAREQRQALDRQLSSQAFYAAESGINDASVDIDAYNISSCSAPYSIAGDNSVRNTCITASKTVPNITNDSVPTSPNDPWIVPIETSPDPISTLTITWRPTSSTYGANFRNSGVSTLPPLDQWQVNTGALRVYVLPFTNGVGSGRDNLISAMGYTILIPTNGGASPAPANIGYANIRDNQTGFLTPVQCSSTTNTCTAEITGMPAYNDMRVVVMSLYQPNAVVIDGKSGANTDLSFSNAQAVIDSTGKANDVVRRIQVRKPLTTESSVAGGALETTDPSGGICKLIQASPVSTTPGAGCSF